MTKKELIQIAKIRYKWANKKEKGLILDEFCKNSGYNRNYISQILQPKYENNKVAKYGRKRRPLKYSPELIETVIFVWELLDYPCGARLKPSLLPIINALKRHKEIKVNSDIQKQLKIISAKTLDRRLKKEKEIRRLRKNRGTTRH